ncbi:MAG: DUF3237 family protein [Corynebacteriales bacterium]|nr:DUF3237 family protein [Mycobacteriales bacterium]
MEESSDFLAPPVTSFDVEHLCDVAFSMKSKIFETPLGSRMVVIADEGRVRGPRLRGTMYNFGGRALFTSDGVVTSSATCMIHTHDGAEISLLIGAQAPLPAEEPQQTFYTEKQRTWQNGWGYVTFETSAEPYRWLNVTFAVIQTATLASEVYLRLYRMT